MSVAAPHFDAFLATDEGFIDLNGLASAAHWIKRAGHERLANAMRHEPSGFQGHAKNAVKLVRADTFLRRAKKMDCLEPNAHRDVTGLEDGSDFDGKGLAAFVALADANAGRFAAQELHALGVGVAAMRADRAIRPNARLDIGVGGAFIVEVAVRKDGDMRLTPQWNQPTPHCLLRQV